MPASTDAKPTSDETTDLSKQYDTPLGLAHTTMQALKDRIKLHYDLASDYYLNLWYAHPALTCLVSNLTLAPGANTSTTATGPPPPPKPPTPKKPPS
jgi:hypothetical protein